MRDGRLDHRSGAAATAPDGRRAHVVSIVFTGTLAGILSARIVSGLLSAWLSWRILFVLSAAIAAAMCAVAVFALPRRAAPHRSSYVALIGSTAWQLVRFPALRWLSLIGALTFGTFRSFWITLTFHLSGAPFHYGSDKIGLFGFAALAGAFVATPFGRLADRIDPVRVQALTLGILVCGALCVLIWPMSVSALVMAALLLDVGVQGTQVNGLAQIYRLDETAHARINTIYIGTFFIGGALGSACGIKAWEWGGWSLVGWRDWSWDGLDRVEIWRDGALVGTIAASDTAGHEASCDGARDRSRLLFLDAIDPKPAPGADPRPLTPAYEIRPVFRVAPSEFDAALTASLVLPVVTPPAQIPQIVAAGLALSAYERTADYASTQERMKAVWLEFDRIPDDPEDGYFTRLLATAPDPVLTDIVANVPDIDEPPLPIDPEPIRRITPGQGDDHAGAAAIQPLLPTSSPVHFLLPLPAGLTEDSPELFGFFTYEFRVGHVGPWSTAQGRFGRPLRVTGIQHAPPPLTCAVTRTNARPTVSAAFADPVVAGRLVQPDPPVTELWALLYARVVQADGADHRNILLGTRRLVRGKIRSQRQWGKADFAAGRQRTIAGAASWSANEIVAALKDLTLGPDEPLGCLVVETLPGEQPYFDPLGAQLGYERFLRTSPLASVPTIC